MKWLGLLLSLSLSSLLAGTSLAGGATPSYYTISGIDPGGVITEYANKYIALEKTGVTVKVDGMCISACTQVLAYFPQDRICMTERAAFGFHEASMSGTEDEELTKAYFRIFPAWVLQWLIARGGVNSDPIYAFAEDFKDHIQLCPGSHYPDVDMKKLIKTEDSGNEKIIFKPH